MCIVFDIIIFNYLQPVDNIALTFEFRVGMSIQSYIEKIKLFHKRFKETCICMEKRMIHMIFYYHCYIYLFV